MPVVRSMRYLSVCSGIEAASVAWHPLGWEAVGFSEIEAFPSAVLAHHFPTVPNFGDLTRHAEWNLKPGTVDLLVGGTPCQSFSVAGLRAGMADPRGNLALTFLALVDRQRPRWVLWENVPGVLSSNGGRDLGAIIGALEQLGYGWAFRILDAQHFGVPQRRRRLFLVGYLGDWRPPAAVLFEPEGLRGDPPKGQAKGQGAAAFTKSGFGSYSEGVGTLKAKGSDVGGGSETLVAITDPRVTHTLTRRYDSTEDGTGRGVPLVTSTVTSKWATGSGGPAGNECQNLVVGPARSTYSTPAIGHIVEDDVASTVTRNTGAGGETQNPAFVMSPAIAFEPGIAARIGGASRFSVEIAPTLRSDAGDNQVAIATTYAVRRLTPRECERLQGFPDDWTAIPYRGKPAADGPRYKAIGNSMAVPVMRWIGQRIKAWEEGGP